MVTLLYRGKPPVGPAETQALLASPFSAVWSPPMHRHASLVEDARLWLLWQHDGQEPRLLGTGFIAFSPEGNGFWTEKTLPGVVGAARALGYGGPSNMAFIRVRDAWIARDMPHVARLEDLPVGLSAASRTQAELLTRALRPEQNAGSPPGRINSPPELAPEQERYFRDLLREARAEAVRDREGFHSLVVAIERLGTACYGSPGDLGKYAPVLEGLARRSALAEDIPQRHPESHVSFQKLYDLMRTGRNDAVHQGAYARLLTDHAVRVSLVLEDALMTEQPLVQDLMVRNVFSAAPWQPVSAIRETMLTNAFSFLPIWTPRAEEPERWWLLSDLAVAKFLRTPRANARKARLAMDLRTAVAQHGLELDPAPILEPTAPVWSVLEGDEQTATDVVTRRPGMFLVTHPGHPEHLLGVITPFDVL